ncbi:lipid-transfer protein [Streptomyces abyssomicinicus]|uniref:lipid-transfer protein n=1 Tax=Streptomyces abyssomicinicus TaxID=574929 RepID=UPI00124F8D9F|nr:lipid-transfer protein [Streptomyces abyssomicinicus]
MSGNVYVAGVGMIPFMKPGRSDTYDVMGERAVRAALADAGIGYELVQQAYAGYVFGDSTSGQAAIYGVGLTGIPVVNVNNNCASGSSALWLARQAVASGVVDCVLAVGFEQMQAGALGNNKLQDRPPSMKRSLDAMAGLQSWQDGAPGAAQLFGGAGQAYLDRYGVSNDLFAKIAVKSRRHAANNPYAVFRSPITEEEVLASAHQFGPLTKLMCCPPTCGAAAAVIVSEDFARRHGLRTDVRIAAQELTTDFAGVFDEDTDMIKVVGWDMARTAAERVYETAGVGPEDIKVVELHDCFTSNELISYESLGLTPEGTAEKFILDGDNTYGGRVVVNPSGGLMSKGHPLGATGLAQCAELVWQLRGQAEARQVEGDVRHALQHNLGLGGACVVTLYEKVN